MIQKFLFALAAILVCGSFGKQIFAQTKIDISCRPALYFGKGILEPQPMNKDSRYVAAGKKIVLTPADAVSQQNGKYNFTVLYIAYGSPQKEVVALADFTNRFRIGDYVLNQHPVKFSDKDGGSNGTKIQFVRTTLTLPIGESVVTLSLDDDKKVAESNEGNNFYSFTIEVVAKP